MWSSSLKTWRDRCRPLSSKCWKFISPLLSLVRICSTDRKWTPSRKTIEHFTRLCVFLCLYCHRVPWTFRKVRDRDFTVSFNQKWPEIPPEMQIIWPLVYVCVHSQCRLQINPVTNKVTVYGDWSPLQQKHTRGEVSSRSSRSVSGQLIHWGERR